MRATVKLICNWRLWNGSKRLDKGSGTVGNRDTNGDNPKYSIVEISHRTEKIPENLKRLAVSQTPVKDYPLTLV